MERETNWAGNIIYRAINVGYPETLEELQNLIKKSTKVRVVGARHSFNGITDTSGTLVSLVKLQKVISLDTTAHTVTAEGGITLSQLFHYLQGHGYAWHNLPSLADFTVIGACATATHGSGMLNKNLPNSIIEIQFVDYKGDLIKISKDHEDFPAFVVSLGAFGVVYQFTLQLQPIFNMAQIVYSDLPIIQLKDHFLQIMSAGYSVSLFLDWKNNKINQTWIRKQVDHQYPKDHFLGEYISIEPEFFGGKLCLQNMAPALGDDTIGICTKQMGLIGVWWERLVLYNSGYPNLGELQSEYYISIEHAYEAIISVEKIQDTIYPYVLQSEIRTIAEDNLWMSPSYKRTCVAIHTTWKYDYENVIKCIKLMEDQLAPFNPVPHWGKLFTLKPSAINKSFPKLLEWKQLVEKYDPQTKFRNEFLNSLFWDGS